MATGSSDSPDQTLSTRAEPKLLCYETPTIYAFPTSLAAVRNILEYDCTPWLSECPRDPQDNSFYWRSMQVAGSKRRERDSAAGVPKILPFGTSGHVHIYAVFPHLEIIGQTAKCQVFKKWHDKVIRPSFGKFSRTASFYNTEYPVSHELAVLDSEEGKLNSQCQGIPEAPLLPIHTSVGPRNLGAIWEAIVQQTTQRGFQEFRDVFLVVVFDPMTPIRNTISFGQTDAENHDESLAMAMKFWEGNVNAKYVPKGQMEYRVQSTWCV